VASRRAAMPLRLILLLLAFVGVAVPAARDARADAIPPPTELPSLLTLDEALRVFRARGLDLLIAEASVRSSEGAVSIAGASPNPVVGASWGRALTYSPPAGCEGCSPDYFAANVSDSAAISDILAGKKDLRLRVARNALAAAKLS